MRIRAIGMAFALLFLASPGAWAQPSAAVVLSAPLVEWREEIEAAGEGKVILARVFMDRNRMNVYLPDDAEERPIIAGHLQNQAFLNQFVQTHAMSINFPVEGEPTRHIVLLNMAREEAWEGNEDAVIAREFGNIWLYVKNYPAPAYDGGPNACLSVLANNIVQARVIREELSERGFDYDAYWLPQLERAIPQMEATEAQPIEEIPTCELISKLALWLDIKLSYTPEDWPHYERFLAAMGKRYPVLRSMVEQLSGSLEHSDLHEKGEYERVLTNTVHSLHGFVQLVLKREG